MLIDFPIPTNQFARETDSKCEEYNKLRKQ